MGKKNKNKVTVTLMGKEIPLGMPKRYVVCQDIVLAAAYNPARAFAAALGQCMRKWRPQIAYKGDALAYGGEVIDHFVDQGVKPSEITEAGVFAFNLLAGRVLEAAGVDAEEDFSEAPESSSS
ncbi:MAG: hypothetical protein H6739_29425 [Alphaproteobacteria bacterium]|nr:hypothetical protein [Alphaproteobacteria bacterium]